MRELGYFLIYASDAPPKQQLGYLKTANDNLLNGKGWISAKYVDRLVFGTKRTAEAEGGDDDDERRAKGERRGERRGERTSRRSPSRSPGTHR